MRGLIHRLDARRERSVHSPTAGHSGYAADDFPEAEHDSPYARYDMPFHRTEEVLDTPIRHPPIIGNILGHIHYCISAYTICQIVLGFS